MFFINIKLVKILNLSKIHWASCCKWPQTQELYPVSICIFFFLPAANLCSYCLICPFTIFWSLSISLYPNSDPFPIPKFICDTYCFNIKLCLLHCVACFVYFKDLPAKCSGNLVVLWSNGAFHLAFSLWARCKWDWKKTQGGLC